MSRLIDADALHSNFFDYSPREMVWDMGDVEHKINEMPTIDAIPVEWLEEHDSEGNEYGRRYITVVEALSMWQKEQEAR